MKKLLLILGLFISFALKAQNTHFQYNNGLPKNINFSTIYEAYDLGFRDDGIFDNSPVWASVFPTLPKGCQIHFAGGGTDYKFSDSIIINKTVRIFGDGPAPYYIFGISNSPSIGGTNFYFTSATKNFMYLTFGSGDPAPVISIENMNIQNTAGSRPSAGSGIVTYSGASPSNTLQNLYFNRLTVRRFYVDMNLSCNNASIENSQILYPVLYGLKMGNILQPDAGGFLIWNTNFVADSITGLGPTALMFYEGGGYIQVHHCDFNSAGFFNLTANYNYGILTTFTDGATSDIWLDHLSFENFRKQAIKLDNQSGGRIQNVLIDAIEAYPFTTDTATLRSAIEVDSMCAISIIHCAIGNTTPVNYAAINLVKDSLVKIGSDNLWETPIGFINGYNALFSNTGSVFVSSGLASTGIPSATTTPFIIGFGNTTTNIRDSIFQEIPIANIYPAIGTFNAFTGYANGASVSTNTITFSATDATHPGIISLSGQTLGNGLKTFMNDIVVDNTFTLGNGGSSGNSMSWGASALQSSESGNNNLVIGSSTGHILSTGHDNVLLGFSAGAALTTVSFNTFIGTSAGSGVNTPDNTGVGKAGMTAANSGTGGNSYLGEGDLASCTTCNFNVALGYLALPVEATGNQNVAAGVNAGGSNTGGSDNTFIGTAAAFSNISGSGNVVLGWDADYYETGSNKFDISNSQTAHLLSGDFSTGQFCVNCTTTGTNLVSLTASAGTELRGTTRGFLAYVMTTTQRNAISSPADGLEVYDATLHLPYVNLNGTWQAVTPIIGQTTLVSGTKAISITGLATTSKAFVTLVTPTGTSLTTSYQAVCTTNTITIQANVAAGTINSSDGSVINYQVYP